MRLVPIALAASVLAACTTVPAGGEERPAGDTCLREPGQRFVGQRASSETGAAILAATRSTHLRWVPPGTAVTMEYALGRVTVSYDEGYTITSVACS